LLDSLLQEIIVQVSFYDKLNSQDLMHYCRQESSL